MSSESAFCVLTIKSFSLISLLPSMSPDTHTTAKPAQQVKRPIQFSPKVSIQPKPLITAVPLAHAAAPLQTKTIIIQPLQTTVLPVVKPAPINIQPAPPPGQSSHYNTLKNCLTSHCIASDQYVGHICISETTVSGMFFTASGLYFIQIQKGLLLVSDLSGESYLLFCLDRNVCLSQQMAL